jgi:glycosyltransferase involved in cell wall biosynthesis
LGSQNKVPLFINRFSLSPRTAVGVQTVRLLHPHEDWLHFHWWSSSLKTIDPRSILLENTVLSRYSFLHHPYITRACEFFAVSAWRGNKLRPGRQKKLIAEFKERVAGAYLAPLNELDAVRCLALIHLMDVPFVLHLWDVLEGDIATGALRSLIDRAERVFCVSEPLLRDVSLLRGDAELLSFARDDSAARAQAPESGPLKIVMHGNISSYQDGMDHLDQAIALVEAKGVEVDVCFLGSPKILRQAETTLKARVRVHGFVATQADVDRELSQAHVGFLPGPSRDPAFDLRSRYSIPSRILDYMAVGLPIVGSVHRESATGYYVRSVGLERTVTCDSPAEIADRRMRSPDCSGRKLLQTN